ncbi:MAG: lipopolysaccharide biosynthesis protein, partial [Candidatus Altiarchaeota archaeon]
MGLAEKTVKNFGIVFLAMIVLRVIEALSKFFLIRLLTPDDFGIIAVASIPISLLVLFQTGGLDQALIYKKDRIREAAGTGLLLTLVIGFLLYAIAFLTAPYVSTFFNAPLADSVIKVLGLSLILASLSQVPLTIIDKELYFGRDVAISILSVLSNMVVAILLALKGFGYWSLVYGALTGSIFGGVLSWILCPWRIKLSFDRKLAFEMIGYGKHILLAAIVIYFTTNIDDISVGKLLGVTALGLYSISYNISNLPATNITHIVGKVMFPTYSKLQDNLESLRKAYMKTVRYVSMLSVPAAFGIMVIAHDAVLMLFKAKWAPIVPLVQVLAVYGLIRSLGATTGEIFKTVGKPQLISFYTSLILVMMALFVIPVSLQYGLVGVCVLVVVSGLIPTTMALHKTARLLGITSRELLLDTKTQFIAGTLALVLTAYLRSLIDSTSLTTLAFTFTAYSITYL